MMMRNVLLMCDMLLMRNVLLMRERRVRTRACVSATCDCMNKRRNCYKMSVTQAYIRAIE